MTMIRIFVKNACQNIHLMIEISRSSNVKCKFLKHIQLF